MNAGLLFVAAVPLFLFAYKFYGRYIANIFSVDDSRSTPACEMCDDVDYVPAKPLVLFGHHFASIAGAGPILGPTMAMIFGFIPVWLWIVFGSIFVGAVHDYSALLTSIREKGKSMAEVAEQALGRAGFLLFIAFTIVMILMVTSVFLQITATALTSLVPLEILRMASSQTLLKTTVVKGVVNARIGGIASTSVIIITCFSPFIGYLLYKRKANVNLMALFALGICIFSVLMGLRYPVSIDKNIWMIIIAVYTVFAAGIPVWLVLQPRDFTNAFMLYGGVAALAIAGITALFRGIPISAPGWNVAEGTAKLGLIWPILFITVACGACSGFHALVAGGTTSKQISQESHAKSIAYGGMLLEALLALGVVIAVGAGLNFKHYLSFVFPGASGQSNPAAAFAVGMGGLLHDALGISAAFGTIFGMLLVEGFVITTLDTAVRLNRYLFEELWAILFRNPPWFMKTYIFNSLLSVGLMLFFAYTNTILALWPIFGSANQLLSALTLLSVVGWLALKGRRYLFAFLPALFMMATTMTALVYLFVTKYLPAKANALMGADVALVVLAVLVVILMVRVLVSFRAKETSAAVTDNVLAKSSK
ncbi:MAG: carbon starvation CstA family protein [Armatimonadota bacterium]|nr:carbon starvation CstA family protein [Armatimonadota bacterium]